MKKFKLAKNRRNSVTAARMGTAIKALLACAFLASLGVGYAWQKNQIHDLARQMETREVQLKKIREQNAKLARQLATVRSPQFLQSRINELRLGLVLPQPDQVIRLVEAEGTVETAPAESSRALPPTRLYAGRPAQPEVVR
jgi:hypothetical protein